MRPPSTSPGVVDVAEFCGVLGHFPTGVVVVTASPPDGTPAGLTLGSFTSVSLGPPLVAFLPAKTSTSRPRIRTSGSFCVNGLRAGQHDLLRRFATAGGDKFHGLAWSAGPAGHPVLPGVPAWIDCDIDRVDDAGDHLLITSLVRTLHAAKNHAGPLVFYRGSLGRFVAAERGPATDQREWDSPGLRLLWW